MVQNNISHSISNTSHYSTEIHPYVGEFLYICNLINLYLCINLKLINKIKIYIVVFRNSVVI